MSKKYYIGIAYNHPVCPINASHARVYVVADTLARYKRFQGFEVKMPFACHYSGDTASKFATAIKQYLRGVKNQEVDKIIWLFREFYKVPEHSLKSLTNSISILDYFANQTINDLKRLGISHDWNSYYNTTDLRYKVFVQSIFDGYKDKGLITQGRSGKSLAYENKLWRLKTLRQLKNTQIVSRKWHHIIRDSVLLLDNQWSYEREGGIGTKIDGNIVDPMFDSELFTVFDIIKDFLEPNLKYDEYKSAISESLKHLANPTHKEGEYKYQSLIDHLNKWLPVDMFFGEEHLKNWLAKKVYAETALLSKKYRTKSYFLLGMGTLLGKRMSASKGHSILLTDMLNSHGPEVARLSLLLTSHPCEHFNWDSNQITGIKRSLNRLYFLIGILDNLRPDRKKRDDSLLKLINESKIAWYKFMESGDFRKAAIETLNVFPNKILKHIQTKKGIDIESLELIKGYINQSLNIIIPTYFNNQQIHYV